MASSNLLVVVDTQGRIVFREPSNAAALDKFLQQHLARP
jgi:hypothetical protein